MSFLTELYQKSIADTDKNLLFWEDYLHRLKLLNLNAFADQLKVPALVPVGSRIFFRGELKHTNEITVSLGADYFVKCSVQQAELLRQRRIKDAESKVDQFRKEKEYLENQVSFNKQHIVEKSGKEIIEVYTEEEDKVWRKKHRENVRKYMQSKPKEEDEGEKITDEELWSRLEELELAEELEYEMMNSSTEVNNHKLIDNFLSNDKANEPQEDTITNSDSAIQPQKEEKEKMNQKEIVSKKTTPKVAEKLHLLQQVLVNQKVLENKLSELKTRTQNPSTTEEDLITKLDEMDELDDLEDEIDRLEEMLEKGTGLKADANNESKSNNKLKKSITFADEDDSETIEINFTHSDIEPSNGPYDPEKGITKPSDIYKSHAHCFDEKTNSILKKSKYGLSSPINNDISYSKRKVHLAKVVEDEADCENETIVVKDVVEKPARNNDKVSKEPSARPTSLFKKKRMQNKS